MSAELESRVDALTKRVRELEDVQEVGQLMVLYHQYCDGWREDGTHRYPDKIAALFTPDGIWDIPTEKDGKWDQPAEDPITGPDQIAAEARHLQLTPWVLHFVVNPRVEVSGDSAHGVFKAFVRGRTQGSDQYWWVCGCYTADAVRTPDGWRFKKLSWEHIDNM